MCVGDFIQILPFKLRLVLTFGGDINETRIHRKIESESIRYCKLPPDCNPDHPQNLMDWSLARDAGSG